MPAALLAVVRHAWSTGAAAQRRRASAPIGASPRLEQQLALIVAQLGTDIPVDLAFRLAIAWTQLFGMVTFELFGQFVGGFEPADEFFEAAVASMADFVGLSD